MNEFIILLIAIILAIAFKISRKKYKARPKDVY